MPVSIYFRSPIKFVQEGLSRGLGGAETAALRMAGALKQIGVPTEVVDGRTSTHNHKDVAVVVRFPADALRLKREFKRVFFWPADDVTHPTFGPLASPFVRDSFNRQLDGVLAISGYQQMQLINLGIDPAIIIPTRYGIDGSLFEKRTNTPEPICMYSASPKRGMQVLSRIWPAIVESVPGAKLWICSSMNTYRGNDAPLATIFNHLASMKGATLCGSIPQPELAARLNQSRVWLYPNTFPETASIATLEARAAGCLIVTTYFAALRETAAGNLFVPGPESPYFESSLISQTVRGLTDDRLYHTISKRNQAFNHDMDWLTIACEWARQLNLS